MASRTALGVPEHLLPEDLQPKKRRSEAAKGSYYKARAKKWLEDQGYDVHHLERMMWIRKGGERCETCDRPEMFATKQDQAGADLLACKTGAPVVFVQVKLGRKTLTPARREFARHQLPLGALRWILVWEPGARQPEIVDCSKDTAAMFPAPKQRVAAPRLF